jgi:hypothetical protein
MWLAQILAWWMAVLPSSAAFQRPIDQKELAAYALTEPVYTRFAHAVRLVAAASRNDPRLAATPLFTKEIAVTGDVVEAAAVLQSRLEQEQAFRNALFAAEVDAREFTTFALALLAARLAHGFLKAGLIYVMPDTVAGRNVAFVAAHEAEMEALLVALE